MLNTEKQIHLNTAEQTAITKWLTDNGWRKWIVDDKHQFSPPEGYPRANQLRHWMDAVVETISRQSKQETH